MGQTESPLAVGLLPAARLLPMRRRLPLNVSLRCRAVVFMVLVAPWLGKHLSWALFVISIVLILVTITLLFMTALTNPGYLPRDTESPVEDIEWGCAFEHHKP